MKPRKPPRVKPRWRVAPCLIPVPPQRMRATFHPFDGYPFLCRLPNENGYVLVFLDYRTVDPRPKMLGCYSERELDLWNEMEIRLSADVGTALVFRLGPGWLVCTIPFAGAHWYREGSFYRVAVDEGERLRIWLEKLARLEKQTDATPHGRDPIEKRHES